MKRIHIISGGTMQHIATHLALCAPAYGRTGRVLKRLCDDQFKNMDVFLHETRMASGKNTGLETNEDVAELIQEFIDEPDTKVVFLPVALCDYEPFGASYCDSDTSRDALDIGDKGSPRLQTARGDVLLRLTPAEKIIRKVREKRKDIFLVGFKTTDGVSEQEQYLAGLNLLKASSCNLVFANDMKTKLCMVITPEEAKYHVTTNKDEALAGLVDMVYWRSHLTFTRSTVVSGEPVPWSSELVPDALRKVVDYCIEQGAYKPFQGATVGHFACKLDERTFLTSRRKTNFNDLPKLGLVKIETDGPDTVLAYGSKPSVGGQSQRIIFAEHPEYDCIVHFHCPRRPEWEAQPGGVQKLVLRDDIPTVSQREYECGSHQCGQNTSRGLKKFGNLSCVYLDHHGPNIVFSSAIDPQEVINFIEANFDLAQKTGGPI